MQGIEESVQKAKEIQKKVAQAKKNEKIGKDVLEHVKGILIICEDTQ